MEDTEILLNGLMHFSVELYKHLSDGNENIFLSPFSISAALLIADLGADGRTDKQIREALRIGSVQHSQVHLLLRDLLKQTQFGSGGSSMLRLANRIFARKGVSVDKDYSDQISNHNEGGIEVLDFAAKSEESRRYINRWVAEKTDGKITDLLPFGSIRPSSVIVLINTIFLQGNWLYPFDQESTFKEEFYISKTDLEKTEMMHGEENVKYVFAERKGYSAVELPYKDDNLAMDIILPTEINGLTKLEQILDLTLLKNILNSLDVAVKPKVILGIPKFKLEEEYKLKDALSTLGIVDMFSPTTADFSVMLPENPGEAYVTDAIHKAVVEVNESGTVAAAATGIGLADICCITEKPKPIRFFANHPFIFVIRDVSTDVILFIGRYLKPTS